MTAAVGVVVATRDRRDTLLDTLGRLAALPERPPLVVVDNGSHDGTAAAVSERFPGVGLVALDRNRGAGGRTVGARRLATPYVAFADDDAWWAPGSLARAVALLDRHPQVALLAARVLVGPEERLDPVCEEMARSRLPATPPDPGHPVLGFVACGAVVRRDALLAAGGFDERYGIGGEEQRLAVALAAAGWELRYVPELVVHHHPAPSLSRASRDATALRNDLWTAWLARPAASALRATGRLLAESGPRRATLAGAARALRGTRWVARERQVVPPRVEAGLRVLDGR